MSILERVMRTYKAARQAWNGESTFLPVGGIVSPNNSAWDTYAERMKRYALFEGYYDNKIYFNPRQLALIQQQRPSLYKNIRGIYNPFWRLCRTYESNVYPGALDMDTMRIGAIPITQADDDFRDALRWIWLWSQWGRMKGLYVRNGAKLGDSVLKVVDDRQRNKVRIEVLDPRKIADVKLDDMLNVKSCVIEYERSDEIDNSKPYTYTEIITQEEFITLKDGVEYAFYADSSGKKVSRWRNEYGFVPVAMAQNTLTGRKFGENVAPSNILNKIDEVNDMAALIHDQVRKAVNVIWYMTGINDPKDIKINQDREIVTMISGPPESMPHAMLANLSISEASELIKDNLQEIERDVPELSLYRVREQRQSTAPGVRAVFSDADERIQMTQANYDATLISAQMMAVAIGGYRGLDGFEGFGLDSYMDGDLTHYIPNRSIFSEEISLQDKLETLKSIGASKALILKEMGYDADTIQAEELTDLAVTQDVMRQLMEVISDEEN